MALNPDTGKLAWYFQASPHDTHDWDNVETPVLFDAKIDGKPRKLLAQAARNGFFFVLDRTNGKSVRDCAVCRARIGRRAWTRKASRFRIPRRSRRWMDRLIDIPGGGGTNWMPPSYDPHTGLFYVNATTRL